MRNLWVRAVAIAAGYGLALWAAGALVALRSRGVDPADVVASSGMWAAGDAMAFLVLAGVLGLVPTWFLLRTLRSVDAAWTALSWACLAWAALAPLSAVAFRAVSLPPPLVPGAPRPTPTAWQSAAMAVSALALVRILLCPGSLLVLAATWRMSAQPAARRRARWATVLEASAIVPVAAWVVAAALSSLHVR